MLEIVEDIGTMIIMASMVLVPLCGFIVAVKRCYLDKLGFLRVLALIVLSPSVNCVLARHITISGSLDEDINRAILFHVIYGVLILVFTAVQLPLFIRFVKPENSSTAVFIYLSWLAFATFSDFTEMTVYAILSDTNITLIMEFLPMLGETLMFHRFVIRPLSEITREKQERGMSVFITIPSVAVGMKVLLTGLHSAYDMIFILGADIRNLELFKDNSDLLKPYYTYYGRSWQTGDLIYYIASHAIMVLMLISFAVIVKNISHIGRIDSQNREIKAARDNIKELSVEVMEALAHTIDAKDEYTKGHSTRVAKYSRMLAENLGLSAEECENVYYMGLLHDIGKIGVPNAIINSKGKLTKEEFDIIKTHPVLGYDILSEIQSRPDLATGARWHHERYDGKGYPDGKSGKDIPFLARIISIADSYDAMTSNRSYRNALPQAVVRSEIEKNIGTQFDPDAARCMLNIIDADVNYELHE